MNIVVTSTTTHILVNFNDWSNAVGAIRGFYEKSAVAQVLETPLCVEVTLSTGRKFQLADNYDNNILPVDSVNGVAIISIPHLFDQLSLML